MKRSARPPKRPDRREFLASAALAGAGVALHGCSLPAKPPIDVAVIGAGMAGLAAARDLARAGLDIVVLEARDRVGGRMESLKDPAPHGLELGAQMVHGSRAPTWPLLRELGIEARPLGQWTRWQWTPAGGFRQPGGEHDAALRARLVEAYHAHLGEDIPYGKFLETLSIPEEDLGIVNENALSWSAEPEEISLQAAMEDEAAWEAYLDTNYQVVGGYAALAGKMADPLGDRVRLSCPVTGIDWRRGRVRIACVRGGREDRVHARRVLVTLPIGILQSGRPAFGPDLPAWKRNAINALRMGRVVVVQMLFDHRFWQSPVGPGVPGWSQEGGRVSFWDPHPSGKGEPALMGWITGRAARELSDLGERAGTARVIDWIEQAIPNAGARGRLRFSAFRDWVRDPWSLGSYSFTLPGGGSQRAVLAIPVGETIHFAGEATEPPPHYQTVHGAYVSGRRAAREILSALGR